MEDVGTFVLILYSCFATPNGKLECTKGRYTRTEYGSQAICAKAGNAAMQELIDTAGKKLRLLAGQCVKGGEA